MRKNDKFYYMKNFEGLFIKKKQQKSKKRSHSLGKEISTHRVNKGWIIITSKDCPWISKEKMSKRDKWASHRKVKKMVFKHERLSHIFTNRHVQNSSQLYYNKNYE